MSDEAPVPLPTIGLMIQWLRGVSEPQAPGDRELDDEDLMFARAVLATLQQHERAMAALREPTQEMVDAAIAAAGSDDDRSGSEMAIDVMKAVVKAVLEDGTK